MLYLLAGLIHFVLSMSMLLIVVQIVLFVFGGLWIGGVSAVEVYLEKDESSAPVNPQQDEEFIKLLEEYEELESYIQANKLDTLSGRRTNTNPKAFAKLRRYEEIKEELL